MTSENVAITKGLRAFRAEEHLEQKSGALSGVLWPSLGLGREGKKSERQVGEGTSAL